MTGTFRVERVPRDQPDDRETPSPLFGTRRPLISEEDAAAASAEFVGPEKTLDLLKWVVATFGDRWILANSWQHAVIVNHLDQITDNIRVCEFDTELLFTETYETRERVVERYGLNVISMRSRLSVAEQGVEHGPNLWQYDPDQCCHLRKVVPLRTILSQHSAWLTGIRRSQSTSRKDAQVVEIDNKHQMVKINPLAWWTDEDLWGYIYSHDVPYNPLLTSGYPSIGCVPCTLPVRDGDDARGGRWAGIGKTECGLHS